MIINLNQTIDMMRSEDYRDRFRAEYWQLKIRHDRLRDLLTATRAAELMGEQLPPMGSPLSVMRDQCRTMEQYLNVLKLRAACENIDLGGKE